MVCAELLKSSRHYVQAQVLTFTILWRLLLLPPFRRERLSNPFRASKSVNTLSIQDLPYTMQNNWHVLSKSWRTSCLWVDLTRVVPLSVRFQQGCQKKLMPDEWNTATVSAWALSRGSFIFPNQQDLSSLSISGGQTHTASRPTSLHAANNQPESAGRSLSASGPAQSCSHGAALIYTRCPPGGTHLALSGSGTGSGR